MIEFTFVGIPLIFILISIFEMARGMWIYHTLAYAMKEGTRYVCVRGLNCTLNGNTCSVTVGNIARHIQYSGIGLLPSELNVTLQSQTNTVQCNPLSNCLTDSTPWPPPPGNSPGLDVVIVGTYPFRSALAFFWPGAGHGMQFPMVTFPARSRAKMEF